MQLQHAVDVHQTQQQQLHLHRVRLELLQHAT
jgi:hypothetical protein